MTTFVAIILGTAVAGVLTYWLGSERLWLASGFCVAIAVAGTLTSLLVRRTPVAHPGLEFRRSSLVVPPDMGRLLLGDAPLLAALLASCMFWLVGGIVHPAVNRLGIHQLRQNEAWTSMMVASMAVGIAAGCLTAGLLSRGRIEGRLVRIGAWGTVALLLLLAAPGRDGAHLLGFAGSVPALAVLGFFAGMFAVPVQVYLQSRPPADKKGRMIATMNLANWIAILLSAVLYFLFGLILDLLDWRPSMMFALTAVLMLPVALWYRPRSEPLGEPQAPPAALAERPPPG
jgi:acyl-[acyl-carrier-protein]-phospholipid O-acyltransferase/long-chain-fatty-acid--[acyl-carrier-protein] ligase